MKRKRVIRHNQPSLSEKDARAVSRVINSQWIAEGEYGRKFEISVARYLKRTYAEATSSGTAALHLALLALRVKSGNEVILSTYTCTALLNALFYVGAIPRIADINPHSLGPDVESVRSLINRKTKAILVNHAFGFPADIQKIKDLGIPVIEDCAQSLGSRVKNQPLGSFGDIAVCSFYATKMMTTGYGGMVLTNRKSYASVIRDLMRYDQRRDYKVRYNYCLSDVQAALGLSQLEKLSNFVKRRQLIAQRYLDVLKYTPYYYWTGRENETPNYYRFIIGDMEHYSKTIRKFQRRGIECISPIEPYQLLHRYLGVSRKKYPVAETISRSVVSIPVYPSLTERQVDKICSTIRSF